MKKGLIINKVFDLIIDGKSNEAETLSITNYPFQKTLPVKRYYTKTQMCKVFLKDGFIDRYSGEQLLFPGIIKILSLKFPEIYKFHKNWKISETHSIYWDLMPTIDHIVPVTQGGGNEIANLATTSMARNSAKANWSLQEINWELHPEGNLHNWDGLSSSFLKLLEKEPNYESNTYVKSWKNALLKAQSIKI
tara:strand:- start:1580 stop:2155 length:576 start_codon:yes stop_codon:yes gene_type:complete